MVVAAAHIGRAALLAALEDERAHLAGRWPLRLELRVDVALRAVEHERLDGAALAADAQPLGREELVVGVEPPPRAAALASAGDGRIGACAAAACAFAGCAAASCSAASGTAGSAAHCAPSGGGAASAAPPAPLWREARIQRSVSGSSGMPSSNMISVSYLLRRMRPHSICPISDCVAPTRRPSSAWPMPRARRAARKRAPRLIESSASLGIGESTMIDAPVVVCGRWWIGATGRAPAEVGRAEARTAASAAAARAAAVEGGAPGGAALAFVRRWVSDCANQKPARQSRRAQFVLSHFAK